MENFKHIQKYREWYNDHLRTTVLTPSQQLQTHGQSGFKSFPHLFSSIRSFNWYTFKMYLKGENLKKYLL